MTSKPTMMDVATRAGVSQATVSLVLNGSPGTRFSDATRAKVHQAAEELGYRLVRRAQWPAPAETKVIAFIADELTADPWMALAFEGAREKALAQGVSVTLAISRGGDMPDETVFNQFMQGPLLGFIYGTILTREVEPPAPLFQVPSVLLNCYDRKRRLPSVLPGDLEGGRAATERLIRAGRRRIAIINGQDGLDASRDRLRGYRQALASNDMSFDPELVEWGNWEPQAGYDGTRRFLSLKQPPDAIFCANDLMAVGCYEALKEAGLRIPQDMAVIGFDNREIAQFMRPPLTTLVLPHYDIGEAATELLFDLAGRLQPRHDQIKVECQLLERGSVEVQDDGAAGATEAGSRIAG